MCDGNALVSVIITTYNHAQYINHAIRSVKEQTYQPIEIIVVDDGSTDNTQTLLSTYTGVYCHRQKNQGLSAARNTGIELAKGEYLLFLDADDWLYPSAIEQSITVIGTRPAAAFAAGAHNLVRNDGSVIYTSAPRHRSQIYFHLLAGNFIAMHATVLFRKSCFNNNLRYDCSLKACEDYDLYLKITRDREVVIHDGMIAAYRRHTNNMSNNAPLMTQESLRVLVKQKPLLRGREEHEQWKKGKHNWILYYLKGLYYQKFSKGGLKSLNNPEKKLIIRYFYNFAKIWVKDVLSGRQ